MKKDYSPIILIIAFLLVIALPACVSIFFDIKEDDAITGHCMAACAPDRIIRHSSDEDVCKCAIFGKDGKEYWVESLKGE